jgi:hypothetical protein
MTPHEETQFAIDSAHAGKIVTLLRSRRMRICFSGSLRFFQELALFPGACALAMQKGRRWLRHVNNHAEVWLHLPPLPAKPH